MLETTIEIMAPVLSALLLGLIGYLFSWLRKKHNITDTAQLEQALKLAVPVAIRAAEERLGAGGGAQKKLAAIADIGRIVTTVSGADVAQKITENLAGTLIDAAFGAAKFPVPTPGVKKKLTAAESAVLNVALEYKQQTLAGGVGAVLRGGDIVLGGSLLGRPGQGIKSVGAAVNAAFRF